MNRALLAMSLAAALAVLAIPVPQPAAAATTHTVTVSSFAFDPPVLTVAAGDTVLFVVTDMCHSVTEGVAGSGGTPPHLGFHAVACAAQDDPTISITFHAPGVFKYYCDVGLHSVLGMQGVVVVQ